MSPGRTAGRFVLEAPVGVGGMATVWRGRDPRGGAPVAVKVIHPRAEALGVRLEREAEVLSGLDHPGIVGYIAHGKLDDGARYLVMEWLEGEDLAARLSRGPLSPGEAAEVARQVAAALAAAHDRGIVHGDVSPANLFLEGGELGRLRVVDFGLARAVGGRGDLPMGTPGFMAPEQVRGDGEAEPAADVFALGCVLFECLAGRAPFVGGDPTAVMLKVLLEDAPPLHELAGEVPAGLEALVAAMMSKQSLDRPPDAGAVLAALEGALDEEVAADHDPGAGETLTQAERRVVTVVVVRLPGGADAALGDVLVKLEARRERLRDGTLVALLAGSAEQPRDQASRAARCALEIRTRIPGASVGLATGPGVVAARLPVGPLIDRAVALLGTEGVRVDETTGALLQERFVIDAGGVLQDERHEAAWVGRTVLGRRTPFVGRAAEQALLESLFESCASEPVSRVVVVTGVAGVGKSRLRVEFLERVRRRRDEQPEPEVLVAHADPLGVGSPFGMVAQITRRACGISPGEGVEERRAKLLERVGRHLPGARRDDVVFFLGELVGVPFEASSVRHRAAREDARIMADQMRAAWVEWLGAECAARPVVMVLEDLHEGDHPTVNYVDAALRALRDRPLFVLALARPEVRERFPRLWIERSPTEVRIAGLTRGAATALVRSVLGARVGDEDLDALVERADGNAFFLEELIRASAEGAVALPATVLGGVEARLDALEPEARRLLRAGSVFGQTFRRGGVVALTVGERSELEVSAHLSGLIGREIVAPVPSEGEPRFAFRHSLVRDVAYAMLTDEDRTLGHKLAGEYLERAGERDPLVLAEHFVRGGEPARAVGFFIQAAEEALEGNDLEGAVQRGERGLACGAGGVDRGRLRLIQAEACRWLGRLEGVERYALDAVETLANTDSDWHRAAGLVALARGRRGARDAVFEWKDTLSSAPPPSEGARVASITALCHMAEAFLVTGRYDLADAFAARAKGLAAGDLDRDPRVAVPLHAAIGFRATHVGNLGAAVECYQRAAEAALALGDQRAVCNHKGHLSALFLELGQWARAETQLTEVLRTGEALGLDLVVAYARVNRGFALARLGRLDEARGLELQAAVGFPDSKRIQGGSRNYLAEVLRLEGELFAAEAEAKKAVSFFGEFPPLRALALARLGLIRLDRGDEEKAREVAEEALEILTELGGLEEGEPLVRLVAAKARLATAEVAAGRAALKTARERLMERAARINDPALRRGFLEDVPENAETLRLAGALGI